MEVFFVKISKGIVDVSGGARIFGHGGLSPSKPSKYEISSVFPQQL
jgi:hypothetical protein